jgi:hypothetical protein
MAPSAFQKEAAGFKLKIGIAIEKPRRAIISRADFDPDSDFNGYLCDV